jgi:hypothetical protein
VFEIGKTCKKIMMIRVDIKYFLIKCASKASDHWSKFDVITRKVS